MKELILSICFIGTSFCATAQNLEPDKVLDEFTAARDTFVYQQTRIMSISDIYHGYKPRKQQLLLKGRYAYLKTQTAEVREAFKQLRQTEGADLSIIKDVTQAREKVYNHLKKLEVLVYLHEPINNLNGDYSVDELAALTKDVKEAIKLMVVGLELLSTLEKKEQKLISDLEKQVSPTPVSIK